MVLTMHGFSNAGYFTTLGLLSLIGSMAFWFRDVISEGTFSFRDYINFITALEFRHQFENIEQSVIKFCSGI